MKKTTYQIPEIRDDKDNIIQSGTYGKNSPLCNDTNDGVLDYINNNLEYLKNTQDTMQSDVKSTYATKNELKSASEESAAALNKKISDDSSSITTSNLTATTTTTASLTATGETSVPTANAGNKSKTIANTEYVQNSIASLVDSAPDTLNTLNELAKALGNDANFATTVTNNIGEKVSKSGDTITGPILYSKTPNDNSELINKAYADKLASSAKSEMVDMLYPVGTVYMSADKSKTKADFSFMRYGTWEEVPANLCLQTGNVSEAGTQRNAGLPNITGRRVASWGGGDYSQRGYVTGCFKFDPDPAYATTINGDNWNDGHGTGFSFDASLSNPIYGSSDTVQPPAYMVRAWVRTA